MIAGITANSPEELVRLIATGARTAYQLTLVGHPAPIVAAVHRRMTHPVPGDLVVEISTFYRPRNVMEAVGRLERVEVGPCPDAPADDDPADASKWEDVWWIKAMTGQTVRWHNCQFVAVYEPGISLEEWAAPINLDT